MPKLETVKIHNPKNPSKYVLINLHDLDLTKHKLYDPDPLIKPTVQETVQKKVSEPEKKNEQEKRLKILKNVEGSIYLNEESRFIRKAGESLDSPPEVEDEVEEEEEKQEIKPKQTRKPRRKTNEKRRYNRSKKMS